MWRMRMMWVVVVWMMTVGVVVMRMVTMWTMAVRVMPMALELASSCEYKANVTLLATCVTRFWARSLCERIVAKTKCEHVETRRNLRRWVR